jgi:biopolymer transport protein ExbB/TolQ
MSNLTRLLRIASTRIIAGFVISDDDSAELILNAARRIEQLEQQLADAQPAIESYRKLAEQRQVDSQAGQQFARKVAAFHKTKSTATMAGPATVTKEQQ